MSREFRVTPKRIKRTNGQVLTPDMSVVVTTKTHATSPFTNGAQELKEAYMRLYGFDYQKACCHLSDFDFEVLDCCRGIPVSNKGSERDFRPLSLPLTLCTP